MKKLLVISTLAVSLATASAPSSAAVPLLVPLLVPVISRAPTLVSGVLRAAIKPAVKQISKFKGPIVKTGPTAGKVRSRNADGRWRAKRSDAGTPRN